LEVFLCAKGDRQALTTFEERSIAGHNPIEGFITSGHLDEVELHFLQRLYEDDVLDAAPVNEGLRQKGTVNYGVDDQWVGPGVRDVNLMIFPGESDSEFGLPQRSRVFSVDVPNVPGV
jgi:hypothetical protein